MSVFVGRPRLHFTRIGWAGLVLCAVCFSSGAQEGLSDEERQRYRGAALESLDNILEHGGDRYGDVHTPMIASVIDTRTGVAPRVPEELDSMIRTEGRLHRRNPGGADLFDDQALIRTLYAAAELTDDERYAAAADEYIGAYFERSVKENGLLAWGTHIFYDLYTDAPGGDQEGKGPHEILIFCPDWPSMWRVAPERVQRQIELMWEWHVVDKETGLHNRHDDKRVGCDFAFFGGELAYAFAFLSSVTDDDRYLDWAKTVVSRHWNERDAETNLPPDAPSTGDRYDAHHCFTTIPGPHAALLLKAFEATGDEVFRDRALAYIAAYDRYGWDEEAGRYRAMLKIDGTPVMAQERGAGYDRWKPTGYADTWRSIMFSYEFPLIAAQTAAYAYRLTEDARALTAAERWARHIRADLPVGLGHRWRAEVLEAIPAMEETGGSYAENYARGDFVFPVDALRDGRRRLPRGCDGYRGRRAGCAVSRRVDHGASHEAAVRDGGRCGNVALRTARAVRLPGAHGAESVRVDVSRNPRCSGTVSESMRKR